MTLTELRPRWLEGKVGMIFLCPKCARTGGCEGRKLTWLTCFFVVTDNRRQRELIEQALKDMPESNADIGAEEHDVVGCREIAWSKTGDDWTMTVRPSLDASAAGHWHGHITNGVIDGGI